MTLTKNDVVDAVQERMNVPRKRSIEIVEILLEILKRSLESQEDVLISGFGKFCVKEKHPRKGRNPATGEDMVLDARKVVTFKCSAVLRDRINENGP
ncbi:integration host factor subunit alpha [Desulfobotulus sp.]|jgi:integration host factor subunit alpha|uniref:integration host factor subunit alpha n=1 Tax=Desulfobotulus sp. TaxID=1940337 RepID=UPI002A3679BB|nr:integration host factor subunit alpha [Desulfobotulus sp.]MDY0162252.1 integration host factor subunit alpha [Desulfobotulus sp.]